MRVRRYTRMQLVARKLDLDANAHIAVLNRKDASRIGLVPGSRVEIAHNGKRLIAIVDFSKSYIKQGEVGLFADTWEALGLDDGKEIDISPMPDPESTFYIRKKLDGKRLTDEEIHAIIMDIVENRLTSAEAAAFISAAYIHGFNAEETVALTNAIVASGESVVIEKEPVVDKHCIGGIPNNRTTMLVVPILTSLGFYMPKLSSRAITSPAGTADTMEVLAPVDLDAETVKEITETVGGVMAWGGGTRIAAADDKLIAIRRPLSLDPRGMLLASILAKKKAVSSQYVLIDIPVGPEAKIPTVRKGEELAEQFIDIGTRLGMHMKAVLTDGSAPIGRGVGPVLEARDVLEILSGSGPQDLRKKGAELAAHLISFVKGTPFEEALRIADGQISSGAALRKFKEIVEAQGGDPDVKPEDLKPGKYSETIFADRDGMVYHISNHAVARLARAAGAPFQKGAGLYLHVRVGDRVKKGDPLYTLYSESERLLKDALEQVDDVVRIE